MPDLSSPDAPDAGSHMTVDSVALAGPGEALPDGRADEPATQAIATAEGLERRAFVRQATTNAVSAAGRFFGLSRVISRSVGAAGRSMVDNLESIRLEQDVEEANANGEVSETTAPPAAGLDPEPEALPAAGLDAEPEADFVAGVAADPVAEWGAGSPARSTVQPLAEVIPEPPPRVPLRLTESQGRLLETVQIAVLGINRPTLGPHLTPAQFHWDGWVFRIPSLGWSARTQNIRHEPRVTLFVENVETGEFGSIGGRATVAEGRFAREESSGLLARYHAAADPDDRWAQLLAEDIDRVVIVVAPDQAIWGRRG